MAMYCPQCSNVFEQRLQCPSCGVRLIVLESRRRRRSLVLFAQGWQHTSWGRVFIGLFLAQGLFYGLRHLLTGIILTVQGQGSVQEALATLPGLVGVQVLQVLALLLGGMLAGAGQRSGVLLGLLLGVLNGVVAVVAQQWPATASHSFLPAYYQPLIQAFVGGLGGWIGCTVWKPLSVLLGPEQANVKAKPVIPLPSTPLFAGRVHWFRSVFGSLFAIVGSLSATYLLEHVVLVSNDSLVTDSYWQEKVVTWEIKALAMLLGGALAGACTANGFKQGLVVGFLSGLAVSAALFLRTPNLKIAGLTMVSSLSLSIAGGWFGSQLFPPVTRFQRHKGMGPASLS
jgi:hypothetical protein